jgi:hypothetical protein
MALFLTLVLLLMTNLETVHGDPIGPLPVVSDSLLPSQNWESPKAAAVLGGYQATLKPTVFAVPSTPTSVHELTWELDRPRTQGLLATTTWLKGAFSTEAEMASNQGGTGSVLTPLSTQTEDRAARMIRLGITGSSGPARYGATYREAGQFFYNDADQAIKEVWGEWRQGATAVTTAIGQRWNNVAADPTRPRVEEQYGRVGLSWTTPSWPTVSVTVSQRAVASALEPAGTTSQKTNAHMLEAAVGYGRAMWNARFASSFSFQSDLSTNGSDTRVNVQQLTAAFHPANTVSITPSLAYRAEQQTLSGVRIDAPSASLGIQYRPSAPLLLDATGNISETRSSDRLIDLDKVGGKGTVTWKLSHVRDWATLLALDAGYNRQFNRLMPSAQAEELSGIFRLVLAPR